MTTVNPPRAARRNPPQQVGAEANAHNQLFTAPTAGLYTQTSAAAPKASSALVLDNFWVTATGISPRGGSKLVCGTAPHPIVSMLSYSAFGKQHLFVATQQYCYQANMGTGLFEVNKRLTSGRISTLTVENDAGVFLLMVNGADAMVIYNGSQWLDEPSSPFKITGVPSHKLSFVWAYHNRVFFIQKGTMTAWYLATNAIGGKASRLPLSGVFNQGGSLLFGATWSSDSGSGMRDRCVFVTDAGEFAVYSGINPGDVNHWTLEGVYFLGKPLDANAVMRVGGELVIATEAGLIPISAAVSKDVSRLSAYALTLPIAKSWEKAVTLAGAGGRWSIVKDDTRNVAIITPEIKSGGNHACFVVNLQTNAWSVFSGWHLNTMVFFKGNIYYGGPDGNIYQADVGGFDEGNKPFYCRACLAFDPLQTPGFFKVAHALRVTWKGDPGAVRHSLARDYRIIFPPPPEGVTAAAKQQTLSDTPPKWNIARWDATPWKLSSSPETVKALAGNYRRRWESIAAQGATLAPQIQITSKQRDKLDCELVSIELLYSTGGVIV